MLENAYLDLLAARSSVRASNPWSNIEFGYMFSHIKILALIRASFAEDTGGGVRDSSAKG